MEFTANEMKLVDRLRKRERRWPRDRWIILVGAAVILVANSYTLFLLIGLFQADEFLSNPDPTSLIVAIFWPKCLLAFCFGSGVIGLVIRDWHGNVYPMLLLRLLETQQKKER
jgi:hypothetical protein